MVSDGHQFQSSIDSADCGDFSLCIMVQLVRWHLFVETNGWRSELDAWDHHVDVTMIGHYCMLVGHVGTTIIRIH